MFRHLPLISIHDKAVLSAEATEAADAQGYFWEMHDLLFDRQAEWSPLSEPQALDVFVGYAEELGLDSDRFRRELADGTHRDKIMSDYEEYSAYGPMSTPTYAVNGVFYPQMGLHPVAINAFISLVLDPPAQYADVPPQVVDPLKEYTATLRTSKGDILVELFAEDAPTNVNSFAFLSQEGWYDGQAFFYVEPGVVAHSGDPTGAGMGLPFPGYHCGDELSSDLAFDDAGMLGLYSPNPGSNSSQFFITFAPLPDLTGRFTIIGRVVGGMDIAKDLAPAKPGLDEPPDVVETILIEGH